MDEISSDELVKRISAIGDRFGFVGNQGDDDRRKHKYDVWIANQIKKKMMANEPDLLEKEEDIFFILDWAIETKPNLTAMTFEQALQEQRKWLKELSKNGVIRPLPIENERIIHRCSSGRFLYILKPEDLEYEGSVMGHCVGGIDYKNSVRNMRSIIISLRDRQNKPHITIEVSVMKSGQGKMIGVVKQQYGKGNTNPIEAYHQDLREFALVSMGVTHDKLNRIPPSK